MSIEYTNEIVENLGWVCIAKARLIANFQQMFSNWFAFRLLFWNPQKNIVMFFLILKTQQNTPPGYDTWIFGPSKCTVDVSLKVKVHCKYVTTMIHFVHAMFSSSTLMKADADSSGLVLTHTVLSLTEN